LITEEKSKPTRAFHTHCLVKLLRKLRRITVVWEYLRAVADCNRAFLIGQSSEMAFL
jgi:hypothetical protein